MRPKVKVVAMTVRLPVWCLSRRDRAPRGVGSVPLNKAALSGPHLPPPGMHERLFMQLGICVFLSVWACFIQPNIDLMGYCCEWCLWRNGGFVSLIFFCISFYVFF